MADTLEDLRRHIDDLIGRLSEEEQQDATPADPAQSLAREGLDTQIEALGHKIEGASDVLAELSDLLESQTERIETIEHQLGEPDGLGASAAAVEAAHSPESETNSLVPAIEIAVRQGLARVEQRLLAIEGRLGSFEAALAELRGRGLQRDREARDLEDRVLALAEAALSGGNEAAAVTQSVTAVAPGVDEPASTPLAQAVSARQPEASPEPAIVELIEETAATVEILDSAAAKRLEELVEREVRLQQQFEPGAGAVSEPQSRRTRPTVMVVDDSADARTVLSIYLSKTGFQVVSASSAEDCLAKLRHHRVDAVVLDASMPGASGGHVCAVLRSDEGDLLQARVPVIVYTGYPDEFTRAMAEKWGADEYVVKGGDMLPLMSALIRCTETQSQRESKQGASVTL